MTNEKKLSFVHRYEPAADASPPPLLLLHGTGGDENDLIDLGRMVAPGSALLSPRGKVLEGGMPRFFRRFAEGKFDEDDVRKRANELADFMARRGRLMACPHRSRSDFRMAPILRRRCYCFDRKCCLARCCCARWCRCRNHRPRISPASRC